MTQPECPKNAPYVIKETEAGTKYWCACGRSKSQPYCDGSHAGTSFQPLAVEVDAGQTVPWCGCKKTANAPVCDGSHARK